MSKTLRSAQFQNINIQPTNQPISPEFSMRVWDCYYLRWWTFFLVVVICRSFNKLTHKRNPIEIDTEKTFSQNWGGFCSTKTTIAIKKNLFFKCFAIRNIFACQIFWNCHPCAPSSHGPHSTYAKQREAFYLFL